MRVSFTDYCRWKSIYKLFTYDRFFGRWVSKDLLFTGPSFRSTVSSTPPIVTFAQQQQHTANAAALMAGMAGMVLMTIQFGGIQIATMLGALLCEYTRTHMRRWWYAVWPYSPHNTARQIQSRLKVKVKATLAWWLNEVCCPFGIHSIWMVDIITVNTITTITTITNNTTTPNIQY